VCGTGVAILAIAACSGKEAPANGTPGDGTTSSASTGSSGTAAGASQEKIDIHTIATYPLTETRVNQVLQVMRTVQSMEKSDPQLAAAWSNEDDKATDAESMDAAVARASKMPHSAEIFGKAGISPHDFVYTMYSLMYSATAYQLKQSGQTVAAGKMAAEVNPANMEFLATHPQVIKELSVIDSTESSQ